MSIRAHGLRIARSLTKDLHPASQRTVTASYRHHRPHVANFSVSPSSWRPSGHVRNFSSTKPSTEDEVPVAENDSPPSNKDSSADDGGKEGGGGGGEGEGGSDAIYVGRIAQLESQIKDLKDSLLRSLAEQENTRRIAARDVANAKSYAISSFAKSLLDTSDNLARALDAVPPDVRCDKVGHPTLANLYEGISMTDDGLSKAFEKNGLVKFGVRGEKFDPNMHDALFEYPDATSDVPPGHVGQVMKVGFMLNNRVIRPAEVGVIKAS